MNLRIKNQNLYSSMIDPTVQRSIDLLEEFKIKIKQYLEETEEALNELDDALKELNNSVNRLTDTIPHESK